MISAPSALEREHGQRREAVVQSVLREVFSGQLRAGQHLVTRALAERFGVSHTPVREALVALAGLGIVDLLPNRGAVVRQVTARDVREVCQVRRALECEAVRLACGRIESGKLEALRLCLLELGAVPAEGAAAFIVRARELDSRLHDLVAWASGNAFLAAELGRLKIVFRAFRDVSWEHQDARNDYRRLEEETGEHLAIIEALMAADRRRAVWAMARHIMAGGRYWSQVASEPARQLLTSKSTARASPARSHPGEEAS
jgi:DNA-binding GntR family transcriptional regulator